MEALGAEYAAPSPEPPSASAQAAQQFSIPIKRINAKTDLARWQRSKAYRYFIEFVLGCNESVKRKFVSDPCHISPVVQSILDTLGALDAWIDETPPETNPQRYGNKAFRVWLKRVVENMVQHMQSILPESLRGAAAELAPYWADSFGNMVRIDYGTGHEAAFVAWMACLHRLGALKDEDRQAAVLRVFARYLRLMRRLQTTYWLEPAGSHGVWGLDDYHFLPFLWGAAQMVDHARLKPSAVTRAEAVEAMAGECLYFEGVAFIRRVKRGHFGEHSPILHDISAVPLWSKVNTGLIKMYHVEVLGKFPVIQHFLFGSLLPFEEDPASQEHAHAGAHAHHPPHAFHVHAPHAHPLPRTHDPHPSSSAPRAHTPANPASSPAASHSGCPAACPAEPPAPERALVPPHAAPAHAPSPAHSSTPSDPPGPAPSSVPPSSSASGEPPRAAGLPLAPSLLSSTPSHPHSGAPLLAPASDETPSTAPFPAAAAACSSSS
eukprot:tig00001085_g6957.t1